MGKEHTIAKAETVVYNAETAHLKKLIHNCNERKKLGENIAWAWKEDLATEVKRLDPRNKYDHEEVYVATGEYHIDADKKI